MTNIILLNREEEYVDHLDPISVYSTDFITPDKHLDIRIPWTKIEKGYRILIEDEDEKWSEYIVDHKEEYRNEQGLWLDLRGEDSLKEIAGDFVEDVRSINSDARSSLVSVLAPTRWSAGIVEPLGNKTATFYRVNSYEAVLKILDTWGAELKTRIIVSGSRVTARYIDLVLSKGTVRESPLEYNAGMLSIRKKTLPRTVYTALYGYGKGEEIGDGYGRRLNFASVNNGKAYVENNDAKAIWGRNSPTGKEHVFGKIEFPEIEDPNELKQLTLDKLEELSQPDITYEVMYLDEGEPLYIGDTVGVKDKEIDVRITTRVVKVKRNELNNKDVEVTLGTLAQNFLVLNKSLAKKMTDISAKESIWDRSNIIDENGNIPTSALTDLLNAINTELNSTGGYVYLSDDGQGIYTYDKPTDPTSAVQILGGAWRIANDKLPNGDWNWRTIGTGDGITADAIVTGILKSADESVWIDLDNNSFLLGGSNPTDPSIKWNGSQLELNVTNLKINAIPVATQDDIEDIDNRFTEVENTVGDKADNTIIEEVIDEVENLKGQVSNSAPKGQLIDLANEYALLKENYELSKTETENSLAELRGDSANITVNLQGATKITEFLNTFIHESNRGMFIGSKDENDGILISPKKISFMSDTHETASIEGNLMVINYGIFVKSIQVGRHAQTTNDNGVTIFTYVREV